MKARNIFLLIICVVLLIQCKSGGNKSIVLSVQSDTIANATSSRMTYLLPSPDEVLSEIISAKMSLFPELVNPKANALKYLDKKSITLNLGVYIADFAYLNLNNNKTNALEYFKLIRDLCQKLNVYGLFNEAFFTRVQNNLMNNDSLSFITADMYSHLSEVLANSNRLEEYTLISSGALIESLYLSALSIPNFKNYSKIVKKLFEQKLLLENYYNYASQFKSNKDVNSALVQLDSIKVIFDLPGVKSSKRIITKDKQNHLVIKGGDEVKTNGPAFFKFVKRISEIRKNIIQY